MTGLRIDMAQLAGRRVRVQVRLHRTTDTLPRVYALYLGNGK